MKVNKVKSTNNDRQDKINTFQNFITVAKASFQSYAKDT
jgi:hypothetical protein